MTVSQGERAFPTEDGNDMSEETHEASPKPNNSGPIQKYTLLFLVLACLILLATAQLLEGSDPLEPSTYNSYTRQAMQWRKGKIALDGDVTFLELAIYEGEYYVSFPPVPTVPIFLLTFIWGEDVPDTLLLQLYSVIACVLVYTILKRAYGSPVLAAVWAFLLCFASSMLPILQDGAVWYQAQILAFLLTVAAIERTQKGKLTTAMIFFALSVGCRPFNVLYGPLLLLYSLQTHLRGLNRRRKIMELLPGVLFGLSIAAMYALYNYIRFDNIFEFGHNYLPEFSQEGGVQFAFSHILNHLSVFIWGLPFTQTAEGLAFTKFGFSLFLASPVFICYLLWAARDIIKRRMSVMKTAILITFFAHVLLLLSHRTGGGFQYGARYFVDCIPYVLLYLILPKKTGEAATQIGLAKPPWIEYALLCFGLIHNMIGLVFINL